ncbi:MAG: thioredoxin domain-containing protein [Patescibacteria group bacterium]
MSEQEVTQNSEPKKVNKFGIDKIILIVSLLGFIIVSVLWAKDKGAFDKIFSKGSSSNKDAVKVELYVMSKCPYGIQAENALEGAVKKLGKAIDLNINYIADEDGKGGFSSLHGETEVVGDIAQLCAKKYDANKYFDMILCQNKDSANIGANWEACAKEVKLSNIDKIKACTNGAEGKSLLTENIKLAKAASVSGSPTYYINGTQYQGGRDEGSIVKAVCGVNSKISACKSLPVCFSDNDCSDNVAKIGKCINAGDKTAKCEYSDPKIVNLTILNDKRCSECVAIEPQITDSLKQIFKGLQTKVIDYSSEEGKKIVSDIPGIKLPAYLFAADVKDGEGYSNVQQYLSESAGYQLLALGSEFDPTKEICDNKIDDNGNKKIDCADLECSGSTVCRKEISKRLDVFVMSDCPYGNMAEKAVTEVVNIFAYSIS